MYIALSVVTTMLWYQCQIIERIKFILRNLLLVEENTPPAGNRTLVTRVRNGLYSKLNKINSVSLWRHFSRHTRVIFEEPCLIEILCRNTKIKLNFIEISFSKKPPRQGIEPWSPAWQAGILTTILPRNALIRNSWRQTAHFHRETSLTPENHIIMPHGSTYAIS